MIVTIVTDVRIHKIKDSYYAASAFYRILERYARCFGKVNLITRIVESDSIPKDYNTIDYFCSELINVYSIQHSFFSNNEKVNKAIRASDLIVLRLPSLVAISLYKYVRRNNKVYLTEAMGCAWDAYWNHGLLGKLLAPYSFLRMRRIIKKANYATYVTSSFLQKRYPCKNPSIGVSNVNIIRTYKPKPYSDLSRKRYSFITAASLDVRYKGQQYMIKAISLLKKRGVVCDYYLAGDGDKTYLNNVAKRYKVEKLVHFLGPVRHEELLESMQKYDFYVQPSLQEGLPRSVIEAMSCGCVCFGSNTAGIPELLETKYIFKRKSAYSLTDVILNAIRSGGFYETSKRNIKESQKYCSDILDKKRYKYYEKIIKDLKEIA